MIVFHALEWLSQHDSDVVFSAGLFQFDSSLVRIVPDRMLPEIDVLKSLVCHQVDCRAYRALDVLQV